MKVCQLLYVLIISTEHDIFPCLVIGVVIAKALVYFQHCFFLNDSSVENRGTICVLFH